MHIKKHPSQEELKQFFDYDNGWLIRKSDNKRVGWLSKKGYVTVSYKNIKYQAHRLIYIWHNGNISNEELIDHKDDDKSNNVIDNLQITSNQQNCNKRIVNKENSHKGALLKANGTWRSIIRHRNKQIALGTYKNEDDAITAYDIANILLNGKFAITNKPIEIYSKIESFKLFATIKQKCDIYTT